MRVLLTGASGLIGSAVKESLTADRHDVAVLVRDTNQPDQPHWNPARNEIHLGPAGDLDAVIHLAGENIAQRWNAATRKRIYQSRVAGTRLVCEAVANLAKPPRVLLCASATGIYGDRGDEILTEASRSGEGFLAKVVSDWEAATAPASEAGIRVVHLRFGIVLHPSGGALAKMLPIFRAGLGGKLGSGKQYWSWVTRDDAVSAIRHCLANERIAGPVNVVSPHPVTNAQFTRALGAALRRPAWFTVPRFALKLTLGEMAEETMFVSFRVQPARLLESGFAFRFSDLETALRSLLSRGDRS